MCVFVHVIVCMVCVYVCVCVCVCMHVHACVLVPGLQFPRLLMPKSIVQYSSIDDCNHHALHIHIHSSSARYTASDTRAGLKVWERD